MEQSMDQRDISAVTALQPSEPKRHAACDECRVRKLKCSGHRPVCERCARERILPCVYSPQKQMGRPRKRRRGEENGSVILASDVRVNGDDNPSAPHSSSDSPHSHSGYGDRTAVGGGDGGRNGWQARGETGDADGGMEGVVAVGDEMGFGGFEGFDLGGANGHDLDGVGGSAGGDVWELDPSFSLDPLLAGELIGSGMEESGGFESEQQQSVGSVSHSSSQSGHGLHGTPPSQEQASNLGDKSFIANPIGMPCACLSNVYLTLSSLHSLASYDFPFVLPSLRTAISTANTVLHCPQCPQNFASATQNIHLLLSLLTTLSDSVTRLLAAIEAEATRVAATGQRKQFLMADASAPAYMHTGTHDCPVRFDMALTAAEWRDLARKVVKRQLVGSADEAGTGDAADCTLYGTLAAFARRQNRWHDDHDMKKIRVGAMGLGTIERLDELSKTKLCVQNVEHVKMRLDMLDL